MQLKRLSATLHPDQFAALEQLMKDDMQFNTSAYIAFLIMQEVKRRKDIDIKNPVGRPRKHADGTPTDDAPNPGDGTNEEDPWNLAQYDDTRYDIEHPYADQDNDFLTLRGYHRFMIKWKGIDMTTGKPRPYDAPNYVHREDYTAPKDAPKALKAPLIPPIGRKTK